MTIRRFIAERRSGRWACTAVLALAVAAMGACSSTPEDATGAASTTTSGSLVSPDAPEPTTIDPSSATAALGDLPGRLAARLSSGELVLLDPTGGRVDTLAPAERLHNQPTWSNDGGSIAWASAGTDGSGATILDLASGERTQVDLTPAPFYFNWSPADDRLAALRPTPRGIELSTITGGEHRQLGFGQPFFFVWNPDGATITAAVGGQSYGTIDPDVGALDIERDAGLALFQTPAVTRDGDIVLPFASGALDIDGFELVRISNDDRTAIASGRGGVAMTRNPIDDRLAVLVGTGGDPEVQLVGFQFEEPVELASGSVSIIDLASGAVRTLDVDGPVGMQWSPDGRRLLIFEADQGELGVHYAGADTVEPGPRFTPSVEFAQSYLPFLDQYNHSVSWWSPDGTAVVISGSIDGVRGIHVDIIDDGLAPVLVAEGDIATWSP